MLLRYIFITFGFACLCGASSPDDAMTARPVCDSHHAGLLFPTAANTDKTLAQQMLRCGGLLMCSRTINLPRYKWQPLSVTVEQLKAKRKHAPPPQSCPVVVPPREVAR